MSLSNVYACDAACRMASGCIAVSLQVKGVTANNQNCFLYSASNIVDYFIPDSDFITLLLLQVSFISYV